jgi:hypothetical protein
LKIVVVVELEEVNIVEAEVVTKKESLSLQETEVESSGVYLVVVQEFLNTAASEKKEVPA